MTQTFTKNPTVNTGDIYTAANYTAYTKNNFAVLANLGHKLIPADFMYTPLTGAAATLTTIEPSTGTNKPTGEFYVFADAALNNIEMNIIVPWRTGSYKMFVDLFGFMDTANTGTKYVRMALYYRFSGDGDSIFNEAHSASIGFDWEVNNNAYYWMFDTSPEITPSGAGSGYHGVLRVARAGGNVNDTALGSLYLAGVRVRFKQS